MSSIYCGNLTLLQGFKDEVRILAVISARLRFTTFTLKIAVTCRDRTLFCPYDMCAEHVCSRRVSSPLYSG